MGPRRTWPPAGLPRAWRRASARPTGCSRRGTAAERGTDIVVGFVETHGRPHTAAAARRPRGRAASADRVPRRGRRGDGHRRHPRPPPRSRWSTSWPTRTRPGRAREALGGRRGPARRRHPRRQHDATSSTRVAWRTRSRRSPARRSTSACRTRSCAAADEIELVDMSPHALRQRMRHGNVYPPDRTQVALDRFFTEAQPHGPPRARAPFVARARGGPARGTIAGAAPARSSPTASSSSSTAARRRRAIRAPPPGGRPARRAHRGRRSRRPRRRIAVRPPAGPPGDHRRRGRPRGGDRSGSRRRTWTGLEEAVRSRRATHLVRPIWQSKDCDACSSDRSRTSSSADFLISRSTSSGSADAPPFDHACAGRRVRLS